MHSILLAVAATGMASFANAFTKPTDNTWGPLLTPDLTHVRTCLIPPFSNHAY